MYSGKQYKFKSVVSQILQRLGGSSCLLYIICQVHAEYGYEKTRNDTLMYC